MLCNCFKSQHNNRLPEGVRGCCVMVSNHNIITVYLKMCRVTGYCVMVSNHNIITVLPEDVRGYCVMISNHNIITVYPKKCVDTV